MQAQQIDLAILQPMLESARDALEKGQAQYFTPPALAAELARPLPALRPVIVDLNCSAGDLLRGAANSTTKTLLGCDIDPCTGSRARAASADSSSSSASRPRIDYDDEDGKRGWKIHRITADLTRFYPLLHEVDWRADLFVLNPPWDLHWRKDCLNALAESYCSAVRDAFAAHDPRAGKDHIDSTIATWLIALDRLTYRGEGLIIANHSTMERLAFGPRAPY